MIVYVSVFDQNRGGRYALHPGQIAFTRMRWGAQSKAAALVKPNTACFDAQYATTSNLVSRGKLVNRLWVKGNVAYHSQEPLFGRKCWRGLLPNLGRRWAADPVASSVRWQRGSSSSLPSHSRPWWCSSWYLASPRWVVDS